VNEAFEFGTHCFITPLDDIQAIIEKLAFRFRRKSSFSFDDWNKLTVFRRNPNGQDAEIETRIPHVCGLSPERIFETIYMLPTSGGVIRSRPPYQNRSRNGQEDRKIASMDCHRYL
jgi:hypothetical protein